MHSPSLFFLGKFVIYIYSLSRGYSSTATELYLYFYFYVFESYKSVCIDIFFMLYNLIFGCTSSRGVMYLSCAWAVPPIHHCYICVCINMFINIISIVTAICLCNSYHMLSGCDTSWALYRAYFLYIIGYSIVVILVDIH